MLTWLSENLVNIVIIAILVLVVGLLVRGMIRDKKAGKSSCGSCAGCGGCSGCSAAHKIQNDRNSLLIRTRVEVEGMMCGMCEAHVNDAVRKALPVRKIKSSHTKGETVILTEGVPDSDLIRRAIDATGYTVRKIESHPYYEKKSLKPSFG